MREAKAQTSLCLYADSSETLLLADVINTKIMCAGPHYVQKTTNADDIYCYIFGRQSKHKMDLCFRVSNKMQFKPATNNKGADQTVYAFPLVWTCLCCMLVVVGPTVCYMMYFCVPLNM